MNGSIDNSVALENIEESFDKKNSGDVKNRKRIEWIDWIKAIGIFLVVIGHGHCTPKSRLWIYSFHMPLFFLVSGATFNYLKYKNLKECIIARARGLIIPYICINIFTLPFWYIYYTYLSTKVFNLGNTIKAILIGNTEIMEPVHGPTWFLLTLFLSEVLFYIISRTCKGDKKSLLNFSILLILIGYAESITSNNIDMIWHLNTVPMACGLIIIGYLAYNYIKVNEEKIKKINIVFPIIFIIIGAYISIFENGSKNVSMNVNNYNSLILTFLSLFFTMSGITLILMKIKKLKMMSFIGRNSLIILALHRPVLFLMDYFIPGFKTASWRSTLITTILFVLLLPVTYLVERFAPFLVGNLKKYTNKGKKMIYTLMVLVLLMVSVLYIMDNIERFNYKSMILKQNYVAQALGGIDGFAYTNSKEALENSYNNGFKLFEADVKLTSDKKLVLVHGWTKKDYEQRLGLEYNEENPVMDYNTYMSSKIQGKFTPLSFKDLTDFMNEHEDIYVMIDIGNKSYEETKEIYTKIVEDCNNDSKILNRLIVCGHTTEMIKAIKECYEFKLINLYWAEEDKREGKIKTEEKFIKYCKDYGITSLSTSTDIFTEKLGRLMKKSNIIVYVFTENDENKSKDILKNADLVGTDFIQVNT